MTKHSRAVFLDANVLVYFFDETATLHHDALAKLQFLVDSGVACVTSHHAIEKFLFVASQLSTREDIAKIAGRLDEIPQLTLLEPNTDQEFAKRYVSLWQNAKCELNDALLLQTVLDTGIGTVFSYNVKFLRQAQKLGFRVCTRCSGLTL